MVILPRKGSMAVLSVDKPARVTALGGEHFFAKET